MEIAEIKVSYSTKNKNLLKILSSKSSYRILLSSWNMNTIELQEEFKILILNRSNQVLGIYPLSKGGVSATIVDPKLVFSVALTCNASSLIICHNHPTGELKPSSHDLSLTKKLKEASDFLSINLLDHLIISKHGYFSFADEGVL